MTTAAEKVPLRIPFDAVFGKPKPPPERKRRWFRWGAALLIGLGILLWLLPTIVAHSFLLNWIVGYAAADFQGKIHVGGASLGWLSPVVLRRIEVQDAQGEPLASIGQLQTERTLWKLLWNQQELGRLVLQEATLHIALRPDGSNWEDALARYLALSEPNAAWGQMELLANDAVVLLSDNRSGRRWRLENLQGSLVIPSAPTQPWQLVCTGQVLPSSSEPPASKPDSEPPASKQGSSGTPAGRTGASQPAADFSQEAGQFQFELCWGGVPPEAVAPSAGPNVGGGFFVIRGKQVPLGLAEAILMRWEPLLHLEGRGSGWFAYGWGGWAGQVASGRATPPTALSGAGRSASAAGTTGPSGAEGSATSQGAGPERPAFHGQKAGSSLHAQNTPDGKKDTPTLSPAAPPAGDGLPADAVVMQADITAPEAWMHWERFLSEGLRLQQMELRGGVIWTNEYLDWTNFQLHCQAGQVSLSGRVPIGSDPEQWLATFRQHPCQLSGRVDLARLASLLPQTLRIQPGTQVTSGQAEWMFTSQPGPESTVWQAHFATSQLKALHQGRPIEWPEVLRCQLAARQSAEGLVLETLRCDSEFLRIDAFGSQRGLSVSAQMDLDRLSRRLAPWVDLGDTKLAGHATVSLTWTQKGEDGFEADLMLQGERLRVEIPAWSVQIADDIRVRALVAGKLAGVSGSATQPTGAERPSSGFGPTAATVSLPMGTKLPQAKLGQYRLSRIDSAALAFQWGRDQGEIRLREPVAAPSLKSRWPLQLRLEGQLADWVARLKPWVDIQSWQPSGVYALVASVDLGPETLQVHQAQMAAAPFSLVAFGLQVTEPRVDLSFTGQWNWLAQRVRLTQARLQANPFVLEAENAELQWASPAGSSAGAKAADAAKLTSTSGMGLAGPASGMKLAGRLHAQGTLEQLQRWLAPPSTTGGRLSGTFTAQADVQSQAGGTGGVVQISIRQFSYTPSAGSRPWQQAEIRLAAQARYDHQSGLLELTSCNLQGDGLGYVGTAQRSRSAQPVGATPAAIYRATGQLQYDWQKLAPLLRSYLGAGIVLQGRGAEPLRWQGPLDWGLAEASMAIGWQQIDAYGFRGGPAVLRGQMSRGWLQIAPVEMDLSEGKLQAAGAVRLSPGPVELVLEKGTAARQIRITPAMCASAFQYIAPVLAEVTTVEGRVSLMLDFCRVPLANPAASQIQGRLLIHSIHIGPSPLVQELASLLMKEPTARLRNEAVIPFVMANGRVYHEGMELVFPEVTIRTQGYVGLDQSLALTAEMPILPKWTAMNPRLATAMKGQTIRVPIQGTLQRPQLDQVTLRRYAAQFLQKSAENLLQDELQRQLDRLLKPPGR